MDPVKIFVIVALFFLLTPNILFRMPGNKYVSTLLHGALFALVWHVSVQLHPILKESMSEGIQSKTARCDSLKQKLAQAGLTEAQKKSLQKQQADLRC